MSEQATTSGTISFRVIERAGGSVMLLWQVHSSFF
jgi:hypothetical protein